MGKLIDAEKLKDFLDELTREEWNKNVTTSWANAFEELSELVESIAPIDAVPVVRCKDCAHSSERELFPEDSRWKCKMAMGDEYHDGNFFCAWGERREEG